MPNGGDPGRTRTCDLRIRNPPLYPAELRGRLPDLVGNGGPPVKSARFRPDEAGPTDFPAGAVLLLSAYRLGPIFTNKSYYLQ